MRAWRKWIWSRPYEPHADLLLFKSALYAHVDPQMASFLPPGSRALEDTTGRMWRLSEDALALDTGDVSLPRVPARRAFWFGWHAQFPDTDLVR